MSRHIFGRTATAVGAAGILLVLGGTPAWAHVTAQPEQVPKGEYAKIAFRVPNEKQDAGTVRVKIVLPLDHPLSSVQTTPVPGWTAEVRKVELDKPVTVSGAQVDEAVRSVTWTARPGTRIEPDQFQEFEVSVGALPSETDQLVLPAEQTYDDGEVVKWDDQPAEGDEEPEHPAPAVELVSEGGMVSATPTDSAGQSGTSDDTARWLGGSGLVVGALGLGVAAGSLMRARKERSS